MATPTRITSIWRFGVFEVDARRGELRRAGAAVKIREQSFRILILLLEHAGEVVTREELRRALWSADIFVDFDHSLNAAVMKLREALGDTAEKPLYIETIPKHGYRFIAPFQPIEPPRLLLKIPAQDTLHDEKNGAKGTATGTSPAARFRLAGIARLSLLVFLSGFLGVAVWYAAHPERTIEIASYVEITHDGLPKGLVGTDGIRVYFNRSHVVDLIAQVGVLGGEIEPISVSLPGPSLVDVAPDGSKLLVFANKNGGGTLFTIDEAESGLWSVELPGGSLRQLTKGIIVSAACSPDGQSIVFSKRDGEVYRMRSNGDEVHRILVPPDNTPNSYTMSLAWSPDGRRIRFMRKRRLWEIAPDGSGLHPLFAQWASSPKMLGGHWSPDGRYFAFSAYEGRSLRGAVSQQLWIVDEHPSIFRRVPPVPVRLTSGPVHWSIPVFSRDGKSLFAEGATRRGELVHYDARTHRVQPWLGGISAEHVAFSPDGKFIAYVTYPEGILWRARRDGSERTQLTEPPFYASLPKWSPNGEEIVFFDGIDLKAYIIPSQGGSPQRLVPADDGAQGDPNWSPDGSRIVFSSKDFSRPVSPIEVRILDRATGQVTAVPGSNNVMGPRWSPNGRFLAAHDDTSRDLRLFDFKTSKWTVLEDGETGYPTWSHDGRFIYFLRPKEERGLAQGVYRISPAGGQAELVVDLTGFHHAGVYVYWLGLEPDDTPMLLRNLGENEIYVLRLTEK